MIEKMETKMRLMDEKIETQGATIEWMANTIEHLYSRRVSFYLQLLLQQLTLSQSGAHRHTRVSASEAPTATME